eukprot:TRINITY_DN90241_c0_g1_i1.p1 TRINITY_DN90241_c0_g1~~TRINITY_DN90241_c0_g1_i1.p1  ORF type:complete len:468 (-),score=62.87 TRINITY_DN90241_c0_g1_i1:10-1248(-)
MEKHEYEDSDEVLKEKVLLLHRMLQSSKNSVAYTGAGISTGAGVDDYASGLQSASSTPPIATDALKSPYTCQPTLCHKVLSACYKKGLLHYWLQQNHDGLPQKAGVPQCAMNEIHGSWYDCSNPVVHMSGELRADLFEEFQAWRGKADVVLAFGTSLAGMNADSICSETADRQRAIFDGASPVEKSSSTFGGVVICSLQKTTRDDIAALRIYSKLDRLAAFMMREISGMKEIVEGSHCCGEVVKVQVADIDQATHTEIMVEVNRIVYPPNINETYLHNRKIKDDVFLVPYDPKTGRRFMELNQIFASNPSLNKGSEEAREMLKAKVRQLDVSTLTKLDLREDSEVKLTLGPHTGDEGEVVGKQNEGHYKIRFKHALKPGSKLKAPFERILGTWWIEAAVKGEVEMLPVVNIS